MYHISLFHKHSGKTNDVGTIKYVTFQYSTIQVKTGLRKHNITVMLFCSEQLGTVIIMLCSLKALVYMFE